MAPGIRLILINQLGRKVWEEEEKLRMCKNPKEGPIKGLGKTAPQPQSGLKEGTLPAKPH